VREVDNVITTRDLGQLFHKKQIDPSKMEPMQFDSPFQQIDGTGAGQLFGATGGVMEAAVRTVYSLVMGKEMPRLELTELRGLEGVKEATVPLCLNNDDIGSAIDLKVAVVSGLGNAKKLIRKLKDGEVHYDFVEIMACPGGCINGGGQPPITHSEKDTNVVEQRLQAIYSLDRSLPLRQSHENPTVEALYSQYLKDGYGGKEAHRLLHVEPVYGKTPEMKPEISDDGRDENK
jgi:NADP-reducing hydrogenase subunit HndD